MSLAMYILFTQYETNLCLSIEYLLSVTDYMDKGNPDICCTLTRLEPKYHTSAAVYVSLTAEVFNNAFVILQRI